MSKEKFVVDALFQLLRVYPRGLTLRWLSSLGRVADEPYNIHRKTMWSSLKQLEQGGYLKRDGKTWTLTDVYVKRFDWHIEGYLSWKKIREKNLS